MGPLLHPVGPLPPGAYWLRRALVLVLLAVLVLAVVWAVRAVAGPGSTPQAGSGPSSGPAAPASSASSSPPSAAPTTPAATSTPTVTARPTASASATATASASASVAAAPLCADAQLSIAVRTDKASYPAGQQPRFTLSVRNTGTTTCRRDVGQSALELRVISGGVLVWSSDHCSPGGSNDLQTLTPGQTFSTSVQWARVSSQPGCPANQPAARPGSYSVVGRDLTLVSQPATFTLL